MGEKKKNRDRSRSERRNKKKSKEEKSKREKDQLKKRKSEKKERARSSSSSSDRSSQSSSSEERSRDKRDKKKKKKEKEKEKEKEIEQEKVQKLLNPFPQTQSTGPIPVSTFKSGGLLPMPPPAALVPAAAVTTKTKTKQYHIFKLLPKLPIGCVTLGKTIYSSSFLSQGFENKMLNSMCEQLQKAAKAEGSKKMASMMSRTRSEINSLDEKQKPDHAEIANEANKFENQFEILKNVYNSQMDKLRLKLIEKLGQ